MDGLKQSRFHERSHSHQPQLKIMQDAYKLVDGDDAWKTLGYLCEAETPRERERERERYG